MTEATFNQQVVRLQNEWPKSYGPERRKVIWTAFKTVPDCDFVDAVSECLATQRQAPLVNELQTAVEKAHTRAREALQRVDPTGYLGELENAAKLSQTPEIAEACMKLIRRRFSGEISQADLEAGVALIEQALPGFGPQPCRECGGSGYTRAVVKGGEELRRCDCPTGHSKPGELVWRDKDGNETLRRSIPIMRPMSMSQMRGGKP